MWTFKMDNSEHSGPLENYLFNTYDAEQLIGGRFWDRLDGKSAHALKKGIGKMW
jgi:endonuclease G